MAKKNDLSQLIPDNKNFNKGSEFGNSLIEKSIRKFGAGRSILIDKNNRIIAGNKTVENAGAIGLQKLRIIESDGTEIIAVKRTDIDLDSPIGREMALADNASAKANIVFDAELVEAEVGEAVATEWGVEISRQLEAEEDDFNGTPPKEPITVLGDLYELGEHRLHCADSTDSEAVAKLMNGKKADMVFTDPPYNINYGNIKYPKLKQREIVNDNMSAGAFKDFCAGFIANIVLFNKGCVYMAGPPGTDGRIMFMEADNALHCSTVIIWNKDQFTLGRGKYQNKYEPIWFGWVDNGTSFYGDRKQTNVWDIARPKKSEEHPTMKPIELCAKGIEHASRKDDIVFDLFLGSGTSLIASEQLNRICYGQELDPKYCDVIVSCYITYKQSKGTELTIKRNGILLNKEEVAKFIENTNGTN